MMRNDQDKFDNRLARTEERTYKLMQACTESPHLKDCKLKELNSPSKIYSHTNGLHNTAETRLIRLFEDR